MNLKIDQEFKDLIPALQESELLRLEENVLEGKKFDPIKVWNGVIIDGHNRYAIYQKHGLDFKVEEIELKDRDEAIQWMIKNQLGRRNLSNYSRSLLALLLEDNIAKVAKENQVRKPIESVLLISAKQINPINTRKEIAKIAKVASDTIGKVKKIERLATPEIKKALEKQEITINQAHKEVKKIEQAEERKKSSWTTSEQERKFLVLDGKTVVANKSKDHQLIQWAIENNVFRLIDRNTEWGNPFELPQDGTRDDVCNNYENHYFPYKPSLLAKRSNLKGKVLVCWCYPERCHGDFLAKESSK